MAVRPFHVAVIEPCCGWTPGSTVIRNTVDGRPPEIVTVGGTCTPGTSVLSATVTLASPLLFAGVVINFR